MRLVVKGWLTDKETLIAEGRVRVYLSDTNERLWVDLETRDEGLTIRGSDTVIVIPRASNSFIVGVKNDALSNL